jgi:hypothetical protein
MGNMPEIARGAEVQDGARKSQRDAHTAMALAFAQYVMESLRLNTGRQEHE